MLVSGPLVETVFVKLLFPKSRMNFHDYVNKATKIQNLSQHEFLHTCVCDLGGH